MHSKLQNIVASKEQEVKALYDLLAQDAYHPLHAFLAGDKVYEGKSDFKQALKHRAVIAEIKRKSPSKGPLASIPSPTLLAEKYVKGGANALSILTDQPFFGGSLQDLAEVKQNLKTACPPILRKDFMLDEIQIAEAILAGADAILVIVAIHQKKTAHILAAAKKMAIPVLVEIHDEAELDIALQAGAEIIGINNRNLNTFEVTRDTAFQLKPLIPQSIITVAESAIEMPSHAQDYFSAGFNAVLIGEALVKAENPSLFIQESKNHV